MGIFQKRGFGPLPPPLLKIEQNSKITLLFLLLWLFVGFIYGTIVSKFLQREPSVFCSLDQVYRNCQVLGLCNLPWLLFLYLMVYQAVHPLAYSYIPEVIRLGVSVSFTSPCMFTYPSLSV